MRKVFSDMLNYWYNNAASKEKKTNVLSDEY